MARFVTVVKVRRAASTGVGVTGGRPGDAHLDPGRINGQAGAGRTEIRIPYGRRRARPSGRGVVHLAQGLVDDPGGPGSRGEQTDRSRDELDADAALDLDGRAA